MTLAKKKKNECGLSFYCNWRRLHVRILHSFALKTFGDYGEQDVTWKTICYNQLKARQN